MSAKQKNSQPHRFDEELQLALPEKKVVDAFYYIHDYWSDLTVEGSSLGFALPNKWIRPGGFLDDPGRQLQVAGAYSQREVHVEETQQGTLAQPTIPGGQAGSSGREVALVDKISLLVEKKEGSVRPPGTCPQKIPVRIEFAQESIRMTIREMPIFPGTGVEVGVLIEIAGGIGSAGTVHRQSLDLIRTIAAPGVCPALEYRGLYVEKALRE